MRRRFAIEENLTQSFHRELKRENNSPILGGAKGRADAIEDLEQEYFAVYKISGGLFFIPGLRNVSEKETAYSRISELLSDGELTLLMLKVKNLCAIDTYLDKQMTFEYIERYNMAMLKYFAIPLNPEPVLEFSNIAACTMNEEGQKAIMDVQRDSAINALKLYSTMDLEKYPGLDKQTEWMSSESEVDNDFIAFVHRGKATLHEAYQSPGYFYNDNLPLKKLSYDYMIQYNKVMYEAIKEYLRSTPEALDTPGCPED